ncbi:BppU family phage baseplate upper protein [Leuconostoc citreum]|uniref:BppU family phage baseplate upper protein n=1 Tax=Leuconostoc citreum TaxID=33964 RepID=UPI00200A0846|nr:BppU family phage baseplate upper protein [Leuconostoc citreum]MCK8605129.1 BppU family phage baseplate upper protein [Leuconostoc citreum]
MANKYAIVNTQLNQMDATLIEQLNGRQGDGGRVVNFSIRDGEMPHDISNQNISLVVKDYQGKIKVISTITNIISSIGGLFSMIIPPEMYQAAGEIEVGYLRISDSSNVVITSIPITFNVLANNVIMTSNASDDYIDTVQKLIDEADSRIKVVSDNIEAQQIAFNSLQVSLQNTNNAINSHQLPTLSGKNLWSEENTFIEPISGVLKAQQIVDGTDFNTLTSPGLYQGSGTFPNSPFPVSKMAYIITVEKMNNGFLVQRISQFGPKYINYYLRAKVDVGWQDYERLQYYQDNQTVVSTRVLNNNIMISLERSANTVMLTIQNYDPNSKYIPDWSLFAPVGTIPNGYRPTSMVVMTAEHSRGNKDAGTISDTRTGNLAVSPDGSMFTRQFDMPIFGNFGSPYIVATGTWITQDEFPN